MQQVAQPISDFVVAVAVAATTGIVTLQATTVILLWRVYHALFEPKRGLIDEMELRRQRDHDALDALIEDRMRIRRVEEKLDIHITDLDDDLAKLRRARAMA